MRWQLIMWSEVLILLEGRFYPPPRIVQRQWSEIRMSRSRLNISYQLMLLPYNGPVDSFKCTILQYLYYFSVNELIYCNSENLFSKSAYMLSSADWFLLFLLVVLWELFLIAFFSSFVVCSSENLWVKSSLTSFLRWIWWAKKWSRYM